MKSRSSQIGNDFLQVLPHSKAALDKKCLCNIDLEVHLVSNVHAHMRVVHGIYPCGGLALGVDGSCAAWAGDGFSLVRVPLPGVQHLAGGMRHSSPKLERVQK